MEKLKELKGQNGKITLYDDYIELSKKTVGGFISQMGFSGVRKFYFKDIGGIEYKSPTIVANGYIKVLVAGSDETNAKVGILMSSMESAKDQNTIVLRAFTKKTRAEMDRFHKLVMDNFSKSRNETSNKNNLSIPDEIKKLSELKEQGILTEEEFQSKKTDLLNKI